MSDALPTIPVNPKDIASVSLDGPGWFPYPIPPEEIKEGEPACEVKILRTVGVSTPILRAAFFSAEPSTFTWEFSQDETFVILEGTISVEFESGEKFDLEPNDALSVSAGSNATFVVHEPSRKFTVVTSA